MICIRFGAVLVATALFSTASGAVAADLVVTDCQGGVRLVEKLDGASLRDVRVLVASAPADLSGASAKLQNVASAETITASIENGAATFHQVDAGKWSLCLVPATLSLGAVSLVSPESSRVAEQAALYGVGLAAGVGGVISLVSVGSGSGSARGDVTGTTPLAAISDADSSLESAPALTARSSKRPGIAADCFIDNSVEPISPFQ